MATKKIQTGVQLQRHSGREIVAHLLTGHNSRESLTEQAPLPNEAFELGERAEAIRQAVMRLPDQLRIPLILSEYEDPSHAEIGAVLRCSAKAVETRLYRARQRLHLSLTALLDDSMKSTPPVARNFKGIGGRAA